MFCLIAKIQVLTWYIKKELFTFEWPNYTELPNTQFDIGIRAIENLPEFTVDKSTQTCVPPLSSTKVHQGLVWGGGGASVWSQPSYKQHVQG